MMNLFIICGGKSTEHEVSLASALGILKNIPKKYTPYLIAIDKQGLWRMHDELIIDSHHLHTIKINPQAEIVELNHLKKINGVAVDMVFPIIHGKDGEDGNLQGYLNMFNIPFVGSDTLATALVMDKEMTKNVLNTIGIPVAKYIAHHSSHEMINYDEIVPILGKSLFVKPCSAGSSVGVSQCKTSNDLIAAYVLALQFDHRILIEEAIVGRELEIAVLGNEHPIASEIGEIVPNNDFYSYNAKYIDKDGAKLKYPIKLDPKTKYNLQYAAVKAFKALGCLGMARVDFFLRDDGSFVVNEVNTHPGFTQISMYPKLFEASGIKFTKLIDRLIQLALNSYLQKSKLRLSFK